MTYFQSTSAKCGKFGYLRNPIYDDVIFELVFSAYLKKAITARSSLLTRKFELLNEAHVLVLFFSFVRQLLTLYCVDLTCDSVLLLLVTMRVVRFFAIRREG